MAEDMNNNDGNDIRPTSMRLSKKTRDLFNEIVSAEKWTQESALIKLISLFQLENGKMSVGNRRTEIEEFELHVQTMIKMFINSIELNENAESRIKQLFEERISSYEKSISDYQKNIIDLQSKNEKHEERAGILRKERDEYQKLLEEKDKALKKTELLSQEYENKNKTLSDMITEYKTDREQLKEKDLIIEELRYEIQKLNDLNITKEHELELSKQKNESQLKIVELNIKTEYQEKISELSTGYSLDTKELNKKIENLQIQNLKLEKENLKYQSKIEELQRELKNMEA